MISVLIPTYNYNVYPLVREMHKQLSKSRINFEILVYDDASTKVFETTKLLTELENVLYKKMPQNLGRLALRYKMAQDARYDKLLFTDADMFPKDRFFITKMIKTIEKQTADIYFGGIQVPANPPSSDKILRWKYGKEREGLSLEDRKKRPYKSLLCGTIVIDKNIFLTDAKPMLDIKKYGLDTYFSYLLKQRQRKILHYHNPIVHLGLEPNKIFLNKTKEAVQTYRFLIRQKLMPANHIKLTETGEKLKKYLPYPVRQLIFKIKRPFLEWQLQSKQPVLFFFDIYKLLYYLQLK